MVGIDRAARAAKNAGLDDHARMGKVKKMAG